VSVSAIILFAESRAIDAEALARSFSIPVIDGSGLASAKPRLVRRFIDEQLDAEARFVFLLDERGLQLHARAPLDLSIRADFIGATVTYRRQKGGGLGQMIAKAVGLKGGERPSVLDCTAGLGGDAFVLASLGCSVQMCERVPVVRALLADALAQAALLEDTELRPILDRMELIEQDSLDYLTHCCPPPDVIYLDPMFPERSKRALVKKEMRVFHELVGSDLDADALLPAALNVAKRRVVVKRPRIAPRLDGPNPSYVLEGKSNRYDIYVNVER